MLPSRPLLLKAASVLALSLALAACGSSGATPSAGAATPSAGATAAPSAMASAMAGGMPDCSGGQIGRKAFQMFGMEAQHYCGPATATVTLAGTTATISSGWCETNSAGFAVAIGTQLFGSPTPEQELDLLVVLVDPTTGVGSVSGVVNHHNWLLTAGPVSFGAGKMSGTFSGTAIVGGAVSGSFTC